MLKPIDIGNVHIEVPIALAPLAGVTDLVFRSICRRHGVGLVCTEMVSAKAVVYKNKNTAALIRTAPDEHPSAMQLFGSDPESIEGACQMLRDVPFDIIDFNMGCPVPKVVKNNEGSALMKDEKAAEAALKQPFKCSRYSPSGSGMRCKCHNRPRTDARAILLRQG